MSYYLTITEETNSDPFEKYFKIIKDLSSWMDDIVNSTLSSPTFLPLTNNFVTDLNILNSSKKDLSKIELDIISHKQLKYDQLSSFSSSTDSTSFNQIFSKFDSLWKNFNSLVELGKLKLQELKWVIKLSSNVEQVEVEIKRVEAILEGVEESKKKHYVGGDNPNPLGSSTIESSVTCEIFSSSLLDEWYTKVVAAEESVQNVYSKVKEIISFLYHERFRSPKDLFDHINNIINNIILELRSKVTSAKQALAHDRRIARWFDAVVDADKSINVSLNRLKQIEVPYFINKREWTDEEQNLASIIDDRINDIKSIYSESQKIKYDKIDLDKKANEIITTIKDSTDNEDLTIVDLMKIQLRILNNDLTRLDNFIELLSSQTTIDRYSVVLKLLSSMESMRNQITQIRKTLIEHNDADLIMGDFIDVKSQITELESELLNDDSALAKALKQKHVKLLLTIQNIRVTLAENKLQMAAYLSPSADSEREFAKGINCIRDQLDIVKVEMERDNTDDTTTDASLQELDTHMADASELTKLLKTAYSHLLSPESEDKRHKECFDEIVNQYNLVRDWIEEVRLWFREAVRMRGWMRERVEILLNVPKIDPFQEGGAPVTQEQVDEWRKEYEELERDVENFDFEDVTRLRAHVKGIIGTGNETTTTDMSPAETMTIGITFETLKIYDQLLWKLKNREYELDLLSLRVQWEREYGNAMNFWNILIDEINDFIINRGRWKAPISFKKREDGWFINQDQLLQHDVTSESYKINQKLIDYIRNIIPPTTDNFDELFDTSQTPLPEHLIIRQENIEERDKDYLEEYYKFANDILTQRKQVIDYSNETESAFAEGIKLKNELILKESNPRSDFTEKKFIARVNELNQRIEKSWSSMAEKIIYPHHERHDESESEVIKQAVASYNERLKVLLAEIDEALKNYQRAPKFVELIGEWDDYIIKRKFDVFQEPCKFTSQDIDDYVSGNAQIADDMRNFDEKELKNLYKNVTTLITDVKTVGTKCVNTDELENIMENLDDKLKGLCDNFKILQSKITTL
ncbi:hypothetical protein RIR_jg3303.t1 [Rhizophagus irregularis DAOM 181602=DAOM 197198]|nr:hypothetical protein RIR_jg3303.t1 [Rhizophagus irregularis DAOM 181602=DAOM 197198]